MIDDQSEPGSWGKHLRDTEAMRQRDPFNHADGSREARPICDCDRACGARITPVRACDGSGLECPHAVVRVAPTYKVMAAVYKPQERSVVLLIDGGLITLAEREAENIHAMLGIALDTRDRRMGGKADVT